MHPDAPCRNAVLHQEEDVVLLRSDVGIGRSCDLARPPSARLDRHRSLETELPLALREGMCGVRRAIQVHSHAAHSGAHHERHGEHLIVSEPPGHASDSGSHVVETAKEHSMTTRSVQGIQNRVPNL